MQYQINIFAVKKIFPYLGWILLFLLLFFRGCNSTTPQIVKVPEITNVLQTDTIVKHEVVEVQKLIKDRTNEKKLSKDILEMHERLANYQEEIDYLHDAYKFADSTQKDSLYKLATKLKAFNSNYEDEFLKLKINGIIANNEVKEITPTYTIKERKFEAPQKQVTFRMLVGGGFGINKELNQGTWKINTGFQNQKGNIIRGSFQKIGNQDYWLAEYDFSLFKRSR
jgi:hypothetical protein